MKTSKFQDEVLQIANRMKSMGEEIERLTLLDTLFAGVDLSDVNYFHSYRNDGPRYGDKLGNLAITFSLDPDKQASKLPHAIARHFGIKLNKDKSWNKESLVYRGVVEAADGVPELAISIEGAVPNTCTIVYKEIPLTAEEIEEERQKALANVKRVRVEREIKCGKAAKFEATPEPEPQLAE
jgi:hypothetical protein